MSDKPNIDDKRVLRTRRPTDEDVGAMGPKHLPGAAGIAAAHQERQELHAAFNRGEPVDPEAARLASRPANVGGDGADLGVPTDETTDPTTPIVTTTPFTPATTPPKKHT